jgi:hypothetical protein
MMNKHKTLAMLVTGMLTAMAATMVSAADAPGLPPPTSDAQDAFPAQKHFSPYAGRDFPTRVFWGDTHLHTGMSMDAGAFGARLTPEDAHRFARGEELNSSTGLKVRLSQPLDFLVVADHSDNMGFFPRLYAGDPKMLADPTGKRWYDMVQQGGRSLSLFHRTSFPKRSCRDREARLIAQPGKKPSRRRKNIMSPGAIRHSSAMNGHPIPVVTICIGWLSIGMVGTRPV